MRRVVLWVVVAVGVLCGAALGLIGWRIATGLQYENASFALTHARGAQAGAAWNEDAVQRAAESRIHRAQPVVAHPRMAQLGDASAPFADATAALTATDASAAPALREAVPDFAATPGVFDDPWPWEVGGQAFAITDAARTLHRAAVADTRTTDELAAAIERFDTAETSAFTALANQGQALYDASTAATNETRFGLKDEVAAAQGGGPGGRTVGLVTRFAAAEDAVRASNSVKEAENADPAWALRHRIEDYARSIANGIPIDFEWGSVVAGVGSNYLSGTAEWPPSHEYAIITLNYTIESAWGSGRAGTDARAIVTHEVGHVQTLRPECAAIFNGPEFGGNQEVWATAWAIGMGFDTAGAGIEAYGRPSQAQIDASTACR